MTPKEMLHTVLLDLNQRVKDNTQRDPVGICNNLNWRLVWDEGDAQQNLANELLWDLLQDWPEGTGSHVYPIPGYPNNRSELSAELAMRDVPLWDTSTWYGQQRHKLLAWLIKQTAPEPGDEHEQP